ncbi:unnamed protein product, partial [Didymodactylos carnosus]
MQSDCKSELEQIPVSYQNTLSKASTTIQQCSSPLITRLRARTQQEQQQQLISNINNSTKNNISSESNSQTNLTDTLNIRKNNQLQTIIESDNRSTLLTDSLLPVKDVDSLTDCLENCSLDEGIFGSCMWPSRQISLNYPKSNLITSSAIAFSSTNWGQTSSNQFGFLSRSSPSFFTETATYTPSIPAEFILALDDCGKEPLDKDQRIIVYRCQADSAWELQEYRLAEQYYKKTIQAYKQADNKSGDPEWYTEAKYRQHSCLCKLKQPKEALAVLETIPHNQRSSKIYLALGQLYQKNTIDNKNLDAINAYKECLKLNPNSLTAYNSLLSLGIKVNEFLQSPHIQSINDNQNNSLSSFSTSLLKYSWFRTLLQADYAYHTRDYLEATRLYQLIDTEHIQNSPTILCQMGHSQYSNGDYSQALTTLQRAHNVDSQLIKHMDVLAFLIYNESKDWQLERLANHLLSLGDMYSETWIALGYYCLKQINKPNRTVYLAQKAYSLDNKKIQALLLKGLALYKLKRYSDSLVHYKEAIRLTPYCYEAYKGVVDAYLATTRTTEASSFITNAVRTYLTRHVRAFTLCGQVLAKDPLSLEKAKSFLERALNLNQTYVEAVV